jgi:serine phosphatase RsbU (regulator of sigma subunit)
VLVLYTDGVTDRPTDDGKRFGDRRFLQELAAGGGDDLGSLRDRILRALDTFSRGVPADDDITLVLCQRVDA